MNPVVAAMYTSLQFVPSDENWRPEASFPGELFSFLGATQIDQAYECSGSDDMEEDASAENTSIVVVGDPAGCVWKAKDLSVEAAAQVAANALGAWPVWEPALLYFLLKREESNFGSRLYESLLQTVEPAVHDNWSPWNSGVSFGQHEISGHCGLHLDKSEIITSSFIPGYLQAGDVVGDCVVRLGEQIDEDAELVVALAHASISFGGDGSPISCENYLAAAARDPVLQQLLTWLKERTNVEWLCYLWIT